MVELSAERSDPERGPAEALQLHSAVIDPCSRAISKKDTKLLSLVSIAWIMARLTVTTERLGGAAGQVTGRPQSKCSLFEKSNFHRHCSLALGIFVEIAHPWRRFSATLLGACTFPA